ncbi:MAG: dynamin family protein [Moorellales bacterium]
MTDSLKKARLVSGFEALAALAARAGSPEVEKRAAEAAARLAQNRFYLVVMGQFKRGKSSLINALIGDDLLPTAAVPLTSVVTKIVHGPSKQAAVIFQDGTRKEIPAEQLADYITEEGNPANEKSVEAAEVSHPSPYLSGGLVIVDTPGVGSLYRHNTEVTYSFLPSADAVIFVLSADQPLSEEEGWFLQEIRDRVPRIFFVLNKADYLEGEQRTRAENFCRLALADYLEREPELYSLSSKQALEAKQERDRAKLEASGLPRLEEALATFLASEREKVALEAGARRGRALAGELRSLLQLKARALSAPLEQLQDQIQTFNEELEHILRGKDDALFIIRGELDRLVGMVEKDLEAFKKAEIPLMQEKIRQAAREKERLPLKQFARELEGFVTRQLQADFERWRPREEAKVENRYQDIVGRFAREVNRTIRRIRELSAELFSLQLDEAVEVAPLTKESGFYYKFGLEPEFLPLNPEVLLYLAPRRWAQGYVMRKIQQRMQEDLDRNCGRIRWDLVERGQKSLAAFKLAFNEAVEELVQEIKRVLELALAEKQKGISRVQAVLAEIDRQTRKLEETARLFAT